MHDTISKYINKSLESNKNRTSALVSWLKSYLTKDCNGFSNLTATTVRVQLLHDFLAVCVIDVLSWLHAVCLFACKCLIFILQYYRSLYRCSVCVCIFGIVLSHLLI